MVRGNETNAVAGENAPERLQATAHELVERASDELPETLRRANDAFVGFVRRRPLVALGAAVGVGYVLGRTLRRMV
jgi:ElaB/YqjD/DUF883 family membrane-anchored ribosome-binding protein